MDARKLKKTYLKDRKMENRRDRFEMQKLNTLLSWFNHMCYQEIADKKFNECNDIEFIFECKVEV